MWKLWKKWVLSIGTKTPDSRLLSWSYGNHNLQGNFAWLSTAETQILKCNRWLAVYPFSKFQWAIWTKPLGSPIWMLSKNFGSFHWSLNAKKFSSFWLSMEFILRQGWFKEAPIVHMHSKPEWWQFSTPWCMCQCWIGSTPFEDYLQVLK